MCPPLCQAEALRLLKIAATEGKWLCLKNLHLVVAWLPTLEKVQGSTLTRPSPVRTLLFLDPELRLSPHTRPAILLLPLSLPLVC